VLKNKVANGLYSSSLLQFQLINYSISVSYDACYVSSHGRLLLPKAHVGILSHSLKEITIIDMTVIVAKP
jgi:hypothetical protein